jgi:hypothetical protein
MRHEKIKSGSFRITVKNKKISCDYDASRDSGTMQTHCSAIGRDVGTRHVRGTASKQRLYRHALK